MANELDQEGLPASAPPPWTCKCEAYWLISYAAGPLPENAYAPLEAASGPFSSSEQAGQFKGGLSMIQIVRYSETPVGSYDELLIIPGFFGVPGTKDKNFRVTRIYVSQRATCYNGRKNWNIPKHLARFSFSHPPTRGTSPPETLTVDIFPPDPAEPKPFFTASLSPFRWIPSMPFSTNVFPWVGVDSTLVQPPLPASKESGEEFLCGTNLWAKTPPQLHSRRARGMWVEINENKVKKDESKASESQPLLSGKNLDDWWPKFSAWTFGVWLEQATLIFPTPEQFSSI
ncbi:MAG: hypothetical protein M1827_001254 [Pycnora praestabilis]|nr:MAG: hypothetical protein M1827_001254 [Pycnora praestabilis]